MAFQVLDFLRQKSLIQADFEYDVSYLNDGFWNDNYHVSGGDIDWVVKYYRQGQLTSLFPILPDQESLALTCLKGAGIAPEPVAYFPGEHAVLIYEYWPGEHWRDEVEPVAHILRRLHRHPVSKPEGFRSLSTDPADLLAQGDDLLSHSEQDTLARTLTELRPSPVRIPEISNRSLLHTDVGAGNIIEGPKGIRLIDWQCPGMGDPVQDIWAFQSISFQMLFDRQPLSVEQKDLFIKAYGDSDVDRRLKTLSRYFSYRMAAYCCKRSWDLRSDDPDLSRHYQGAANAEKVQLERELRG